MITLKEDLIQDVKVIASEDYRYLIEQEDNGFVRGVELATQKETVSVPLSHIEAVLSDMKELFHEDFKLELKEELTASTIHKKSDKLRRQGYSCNYDMGESSITITSKEGETVFTAVGKRVDLIIQDFEESSVSLDTSISIEDYCLAVFL